MLPASLRDPTGAVRRATGVLAVLLLPFLMVAGPAVAGEPAAASPDDIARQAVATALHVETSATRVASVTARAFPDGSLGCPEPGQRYAQVITPGYEVMVVAGDSRYDVRVSGNRGRICRRTEDPAGTSAAGGRAAAIAAGEKARRDLATRLGADAGAARVIATRPRRLGEALPGCPESCASAPCGYVVELDSGGRRFTYLVNAAGARPCPDIATR